MSKNNIITAPQVANIDKLYKIWKRTHMGSLSKFYEFMTAPSSERDMFVSSLESNVDFKGSIAVITVGA